MFLFSEESIPISQNNKLYLCTYVYNLFIIRVQRHVLNTVAIPRKGQLLFLTREFQGKFTRKVTFED